MLKIFGFGKKNPSEASPSRMPQEQGTTTRQHTDIQRELVRVVLRDTQRHHGIPSDWLGCEVTALSGRARGEDILVRLIVLKWHEPLLKFLPALQQQLVVGLDRFEPSIDHSKYIVSWQFAANCGCPHTQLPEAASWTLEVAPQPAGAPMARPSVVNWEPAQQAAVGPAAPKQAPAALQVAEQIAAARQKFDLPPSERDALRPNFAATEPNPLPEAKPTFAATEPSPLPPARPKFDLPPSDRDKLPSTFAPTEPGPLR